MGELATVYIYIYIYIYIINYLFIYLLIWSLVKNSLMKFVFIVSNNW